MYTKTKLLTSRNFKTIKGEKLGYITHILYLTPYTDNSKGINLCSHASAGCAAACLVGSGFGGMYENVNAGRRNKSEYFIADRKAFMLQLDSEIAAIKIRDKDKGILAFRLNGTSDIPFEKFIIRDGKNIFELHSDVQFYDYTKNFKRFEKVLPTNYHLTFSRSETNELYALGVVAKGFNAAFVFDKVPSTYKGFEVISGDESDLRFLDKKGVIVGLKYKKLTGKGADNKAAFTSGFAIKVA